MSGLLDIFLGYACRRIHSPCNGYKGSNVKHTKEEYMYTSCLCLAPPRSSSRHLCTAHTLPIGSHLRSHPRDSSVVHSTQYIGSSNAHGDLSGRGAELQPLAIYHPCTTQYDRTWYGVSVLEGLQPVADNSRELPDSARISLQNHCTATII